MSRTLRGLFLFAGLAIGSTAVSANNLEANPDQARRLVLDYATCIVKSSHAEASNDLLADADNDTISRDFERYIKKGVCVPPNIDTIGFGSDLYRYALADALVASEFAREGPSDFSDRAPLTHHPGPTSADVDAALAKETSAKKRDKVRNLYLQAEGAAVLSRYGECVARRDPVDARLWTLTKPGSAEEGARIDAMRHAFGSCLLEGKVAFSKATLRGTVALNYYRLAHAPVQPTTRD